MWNNVHQSSHIMVKWKRNFHSSVSGFLLYFNLELLCLHCGCYPCSNLSGEILCTKETKSWKETNNNIPATAGKGRLCCTVLKHHSLCQGGSTGKIKVQIHQGSLISSRDFSAMPDLLNAVYQWFLLAPKHIESIQYPEGFKTSGTNN